MKKKSVLEVVSNLPKEFELEHLIDKLIFIDKVQQRIALVKQKNHYRTKKLRTL